MVSESQTNFALELLREIRAAEVELAKNCHYSMIFGLFVYWSWVFATLLFIMNR
jgi:hypothetical protein